jgi:hypothetical protein
MASYGSLGSQIVSLINVGTIHIEPTDPWHSGAKHAVRQVMETYTEAATTSERSRPSSDRTLHGPHVIRIRRQPVLCGTRAWHEQEFVKIKGEEEKAKSTSKNAIGDGVRVVIIGAGAAGSCFVIFRTFGIRRCACTIKL